MQFLAVHRYIYQACEQSALAFERSGSVVADFHRVFQSVTIRKMLVTVLRNVRNARLMCSLEQFSYELFPRT